MAELTIELYRLSGVVPALMCAFVPFLASVIIFAIIYPIVNMSFRCKLQRNSANGKFYCSSLVRDSSTPSPFSFRRRSGFS